MKSTQVSLAEYAKDAGRVQAFCEEKGLADYAALAIDLVKQCFDRAGAPSLDVETDEESGEEHLIVEFAVQGEIANVQTCYHDLLARWVQSVAWPHRLLVRFCYSYAK